MERPTVRGTTRVNHNSLIAGAVSVVPSADGTEIGVHTLGAGEHVLLVGGALRQATDYMPFAACLADRFTVHVIDRRGRGASGPLGSSYSIDRECEDVAAVADATDAARIIGHSYGGLVALQAAARTDRFSRVVLYEPAVSVDGSIPTGWLDAYEQAMATGNSRGAFTTFVRGVGSAPAGLARLPAWYVRMVLTLAVRGERWRDIEPLLQPNLLEHREVARLEGLDAYRRVRADVLLLVGGRTGKAQTDALRRLQQGLPSGALEVMDGLDHLAPEKAPSVLAARVAAALSEPSAPVARSTTL